MACFWAALTFHELVRNNTSLKEEWFKPPMKKYYCEMASLGIPYFSYTAKLIYTHKNPIQFHKQDAALLILAEYP
jgi:hypothetical protein